MIKLKNITFDEYLCLQDRSAYDYVINYAKGNSPFARKDDILKIGSFTQVEFGIIKDLQYDMAQGILWDKMLDYMIKLTGKDIKEFCNMKLIDIICFKNYIVDEITKINKVESIALAYEPSDDEIAAGIEKLNVYGVYNQLLSVALGDPLKIPEVKKMKYEDAFVFLCNQKERSDYERRLMEIRSKPNQ